jgi:hypothetical protein
VVGEDRSYAPAWEALGQRYYFDSLYGGGGESMFQRSNAAYEQALALDPKGCSPKEFKARFAMLGLTLPPSLGTELYVNLNPFPVDNRGQ